MAGACDTCSDMMCLLSKYRERGIDEDEPVAMIDKNDLNVLINYVNVWNQKHCLCCFKENINLLRFNNFVQSVVVSSFNLLKTMLDSLKDGGLIDTSCFKDWTSEDKEKLIQLQAKIYQLSFPLYVAYKHANITKNDELTINEKKHLSYYCDFSEYEMPIFLVRKIIYFIESDGFLLFVNCFKEASPSKVPIGFVHSMICVVQNIRNYFNSSAIAHKLVQIRTYVINYLCKMQDSDLRIVNIRSMFEYIWSVVKEYSTFSHFCIDKDGLRISLKYFNSSTLTMRLTGLAQINNYISVFNDLHHSTASINIEHINDQLNQQLQQFIFDNKIIENIFGPNLHVEVIKQSHFILSCISTKITTEHIDIIWSAAQMKHYERYIFEILSQLVKNFSIKPVLYLYNLLLKIKPKDHSEHTLNLASQIIKYIWVHNEVQPDMVNCHFIPNEKMLLEEATFNKNTLYSFFREPIKTPSSSASSVEVSDDEEEDEDFDLDLSNQRLSMDKDQLSKLNSEDSSNNSSESDLDELSELPKEKQSFKIGRNFNKNKIDYPMVTDQLKEIDLNFANSESQDVNMTTDKNNFREAKHSANSSKSSNESFNDMDHQFDVIYEDGESISKMCYNFTKSPMAVKKVEKRPPVEICSDFEFKLSDVCKPGVTLLWDILQDDMLNQISEEVAIAAEKIFWATICSASNRLIRINFIIACLDNLAKNYSVITSIRLLQKLFSSFYQYNDGRLTRRLIFDADKQKHMLKSFFNNLTLYMSCCKLKSSQFSSLKSKFHSHRDEIQIRLNFLSFIFIYSGSHENLSFSQEHINILWNVFTTSDCPEIVDEFFDWLLNQIKLNNGLNPEIIKYVLLQKMPLLQPESFSLTSLELLQHLNGFVFTKNCIDLSIVTEVNQLLWNVAFKNPHNEVSMNAIRYLNQYYINLLNLSNKFDKEEEFIQLCMKHLKEASLLLPIDCDKSLVIIERAVILLKTHLEVFYGRYSYFFRKLKLTLDVDLTMHRIRDKSEPLVRFWVISPYNSDKKQFEFSAMDYLGDLRAEVQYWWQSILNKNAITNNSLETLICLVLHEQEIPFEYDEKRICEFGFKDNHMNHVTFHTCKHTLSKTCDLSISLDFFNAFKSKNSRNLLLEPYNFELLFTLMQQLDMINVANLKARILSRNIWEIVQMLPTSSEILSRFNRLENIFQEMSKQNENFNCDDINEFEVIFDKIFPSNSNQKLIYSCQIVEYFRRNKKSWPIIFIKCGGLSFLYKLFTEKVETIKFSREWTEWKQDCFASLIQTIYQFAICNLGKNEHSKSDEDKLNDACLSFLCNSDGTRKNKRSRKNSLEKNTVFQFNSRFISLISNPEKLINVILSILKHVSANCKLIYQTSIWSRAQVVYFNLTFFTSWCYSDLNVLEIFYKHENTKEIIKKLIIDDSDQMVRKEACLAFTRLCLGCAVDGKNVRIFIPTFLKLLLSFLEEASIVNIAKITANANRSNEEKDLSGPGCKDYFTLVCRLIEPYVVQNSASNSDIGIDINYLCHFIAASILKRENYEIRKNTIEDEGLRGLLILLTVLMKHNPSFKSKTECHEFILQIFNSLFALPTQSQRGLPKCKSNHTRSAAFDLLIELVKGNEENYTILSNLLIDQHRHEIIGRSSAYPWEYWPHDESRSECGFVGLTNLGATCYMASCMQHLFMLSEVRNCVLSTHLSSVIKNEPILKELQKMFIFLQESERKAYNPKNFCKVYTMDHQPLNICEQKDMTEFFTDLITKLEEMTIDLKDMVKKNFSGLQSNNVVSLDCPHISQTTEEFYTLRCQVSDMKDLYESLNELTVKDTLEGDNMYNCSKCGKKVRAEKRACIKKLPKILCFNTMRYTFNMVTMTKEKVNTHFSFPLTLDMSPYLEKNLLNITKAHDEQFECEDYCMSTSTKYELIGVTVHTGTAEGGHYYSFIQDRDPHSVTRNKWFLFNDAEVKPFDKTQLATECFGGETTSKQYDQANDKFFDCNIEKSNSAYMLFYERIEGENIDKIDEKEKVSNHISEGISNSLLEWIWDDNIAFLRDQFIFEHNYFDFIWQVCAQVPQTLSSNFSIQSTQIAARLATLFVLETLIHAKEKPTIANWIELLTKQFNNSPQACEWLIDHLSENDWWSIQILFKCSNQMVRQLFVRLCIHVIAKLRPPQSSLYLHSLHPPGEIKSSIDRYSCVTRFIRRLITLIDIENMHSKPYIKHLTEYFSFLLEFAKQGDEECKFFISIDAISIIINFYLNYGKILNEFPDPFSDNEDDEFDERPHIFGPLMEDKYPKLVSLDKMITLIVYLLEKTQTKDSLILSQRDFDSLISNRSFLFIQQQIRDNINLRQTFNLICSLYRLDDSLAPPIINMIFSSIIRIVDNSAPFFKILSFISENTMVFPYFSKLILPRIWEMSQHTPLQTLEWLIQHVSRNKLIHDHVLNTMEQWVMYFLIEDANIRVRSNAAQLLISLVPSAENSFRQNYRPFRSFPYTINKEINLSSESVAIIDKIFTYLMSLMKKVKNFPVNQPYATQKLTNYFFVMTYLFINTKQKRLFILHFNDFWNYFQTKLAEPALAIHQNKQAFLMFWYIACQEYPESIKCIVHNNVVYRKIAFNYILADHDDQDTILFNKNMLPYYYGILKLCCQSSRMFTRYLATHQNLQWAFQNITPYSNHYPLAVQELFKLMKIFCAIYPDVTDDEIKEVQAFKKITIKMYMNTLNPNVHWATLIAVLGILVESTEDLVYIIQNNGLYLLFQSFCALHIMFHEATACHITSELVDLLRIISSLLSVFENQKDNLELVEHRTNLKDFVDIKKFIFLLNSYTPAPVRNALYDVLSKLTRVSPNEFLKGVTHFLQMQHNAVFIEHNSYTLVNGPYFPKKGHKMFQSKSSLRPSRPTFQMNFSVGYLENSSIRDKEYERHVYEFYCPYYQFIEGMCRFAVKTNVVFPELIDLSLKVATESLYFHCKIFINLLLDIENSEEFECKQLVNECLVNSKSFKEYITIILTRERNFLNDNQVFEFMSIYLTKISNQVITPHLTKQVSSLIDAFNLSPNWHDLKAVQQIIGDTLAVKLMCLCGAFDTQNEVRVKFCEKLQRIKSDYFRWFEEDSSTGDKMPPYKRIKMDSEHQSSSHETDNKSSPLASTLDECNSSTQQMSDHVKLISVIDDVICLIKSV